MWKMEIGILVPDPAMPKPGRSGAHGILRRGMNYAQFMLSQTEQLRKIEDRVESGTQWPARFVRIHVSGSSSGLVIKSLMTDGSGGCHSRMLLAGIHTWCVCPFAQWIPRPMGSRGRNDKCTNLVYRALVRLSTGADAPVQLPGRLLIWRANHAGDE
jgi:hypothetical protein